MWLLSFLPDWMFHAMIIVGGLGLVASWVLSYIPFVSIYKLPIQIVALAITIVGVWFSGSISNEAVWKAKVAEMEKKVAVAEAKSAEVNTVVVTKFVTQIKKVKEVVYVNKEIIKEVVGKQIDSQCKLPVSAVILHNSASQGKVSTGSSSTDGSPSDVKASALLDTVVENYGTYYELVEKIKAWQEWYTEQKKIAETVK
jgi:hypothetical protein